MTAIENRGNVVGAVFTAAVCAALIIFGLLNPLPSKKEVFKTIKVSLAPLEKVLNEKPQSADDSPEAASSASQAEAALPSQAASAPVVEQKTAEAPAAKPASKPAKPASKPAPAKPSQSSVSAKASEKAPTVKNPQPTVERKLKKSVEELAAEQMSAPKKDSSFSDEDFEYTESSSSNSSKAAVAESSLSGTSGSAVSKTTQKTSTSSSTDGRVTNKTASDATSNSLSGMSSNKYKTTVADGISSQTNIKTGSEGGKVTIMVGGKSRQLLQPSRPVIYLDEEAAKLIDTSRTVIITFTVLGNGRVPQTNIVISPASLLPQAVQDSIREELSTWLFSADPSGASGTATFDYTIEVK
ncbi:hypothetical protein [Treponema sp.]|uniref:hypothetical protein n=1 Tax=Treponema sp. TaxID=166 RepID=UPI00257DEC08|nr:hypothetical protein [Treponema sp.]MBE6354041.1 hypothetical protein [Treponema sp.]